MSEVLGTLFKYLLAVLAIGAVVLIFYEAFGSNKVGTEASNISTLDAKSAQLYSGTSSTASLTDTVLIAAVDNYTTLAINGGTAAAASAVTPATIATGCIAGNTNKLAFVFNQ